MKLISLIILLFFRESNPIWRKFFRFHITCEMTVTDRLVTLFLHSPLSSRSRESILHIKFTLFLVVMVFHTSKYLYDLTMKMIDFALKWLLIIRLFFVKPIVFLISKEYFFRQFIFQRQFHMQCGKVLQNVITFFTEKSTFFPSKLRFH